MPKITVLSTKKAPDNGNGSHELATPNQKQVIRIIAEAVGVSIPRKEIEGLTLHQASIFIDELRRQ